MVNDPNRLGVENEDDGKILVSRRGFEVLSSHPAWNESYRQLFKIVEPYTTEQLVADMREAGHSPEEIDYVVNGD